MLIDIVLSIVVGGLLGWNYKLHKGITDHREHITHIITSHNAWRKDTEQVLRKHIISAIKHAELTRTQEVVLRETVERVKMIEERQRPETYVGSYGGTMQ